MYSDCAISKEGNTNEAMGGAAHYEKRKKNADGYLLCEECVLKQVF